MEALRISNRSQRRAVVDEQLVHVLSRNFQVPANLRGEQSVEAQIPLVDESADDSRGSQTLKDRD